MVIAPGQPFYLTLKSVSSSPGTGEGKSSMCRCLHQHTSNSNTVEIPQLRRPPNWNSTQPKSKRKVTTTTSSDILHLMDSLQLPMSTPIYLSLLKDCTNSRDAEAGAQIHGHIDRTSVHHKPSLLLLNRLLLMYVNCGRLGDARQVFERMSIKDSISWATIITAHVHNHHHQHALILFHRMCQSKLSIPWTIPSILKACTFTNHFALAKQLQGYLLKNLTSVTPNYSIHMWTSMIVLYCKQGQFANAVELFKEMGRAGIEKNSFTYTGVIRACGRLRDGGRCGRQVHASALKQTRLQSDMFMLTSLVNMYAKCGLIKEARQVFDMISTDMRNAVCWNSMLTAYAQHGCYKEAIQFLYQMKAAGVQPSESMLNQVRIACAFKEV